MVVHEHEGLGRGIDLVMPAEQLKAADVGLQFLSGELIGSHDPAPRGQQVGELPTAHQILAATAEPAHPGFGSPLPGCPIRDLPV